MAEKFRRISLRRAVILTFAVIVVSLSASFLYVCGAFYRIENLSEITKDKYLPQIIGKQRILVNIETLRHQIALIYNSGRQDEVRKARVVSQALMAEAVFEQSPEFHDKVLQLKPDLLLLLDLKEKLLFIRRQLQLGERRLEWIMGRLSARTGEDFDAFAAHAPSGEAREVHGREYGAARIFSGIDRLCAGDNSPEQDCRAFHDCREMVEATRQALRRLDGQALAAMERLEDSLDTLSDYAVTMELLNISSDMGKVETTVSHVRVQFFLIGCVALGLLLGIFVLVQRNILKPLLSMAAFLHDLRQGRKPKPLSEARIREIQQIMDMLPVLRSTIERLNVQTSLLLEERDEYARLSLHDALTGLGNRWALEERKKADMPGMPLGIIMFDIDFFKKYNDTFGHMEGDRCLRRVAQAAKGSLLRHSDAVFRYGGEEFIVLIPGADLRAAGLIAGRILESIRSAGIAHPGAPGGVLTVSAGVACRALGEAATFEELMAQADQALYASKKNGRDKVTVFPG
ncbi:GGDEF domain-containing protein [Mailhella massiliensis]|uniref:diguanylate cyclase n=1 Tax=Mailhella massiliensis TaxID=1903261 RepID=A0A921AWC1_9BACT|nr:GGDEF domain-containing protein [Mailhella massiliensis]HJD97126.1 GGDEF domain-containing protein [Mailhella massiliensis]